MRTRQYAIRRQTSKSVPKSSLNDPFQPGLVFQEPAYEYWVADTSLYGGRWERDESLATKGTSVQAHAALSRIRAVRDGGGRLEIYEIRSTINAG